MRTRIVSNTAARTRIKVSHKRRNPREMERIASALENRSRIHGVRTDYRTGSIIVHHDLGGIKDVRDTLRDLGVILSQVTDVDLPPTGGKTKVASDLAGAVADLNQRIGLATNGLIDLRVLVPVGLGALALIQLLRRGLQIEVAPWYVLGYAAFDSFIKLHYTRESTMQQPEAEKQW